MLISLWHRYCWGFHRYIFSISMSRSLYFDSFSVALTEVFFSMGMVISMNRQIFSCLFLITMSGLLALSHNLSALEYPTRLWCCLFLLVFGAHARTISRFFFLFVFISFVAISHLNYVPHIRQCAHFWTYLKVVCEMRLFYTSFKLNIFFLLSLVWCCLRNLSIISQLPVYRKWIWKFTAF